MAGNEMGFVTQNILQENVGVSFLLQKQTSFSLAFDYGNGFIAIFHLLSMCACYFI